MKLKYKIARRIKLLAVLAIVALPLSSPLAAIAGGVDGYVAQQNAKAAAIKKKALARAAYYQDKVANNQPIIVNTNASKFSSAKYSKASQKKKQEELLKKQDKTAGELDDIQTASGGESSASKKPTGPGSADR